jgi:hypothetical protein
MDITHRILAAQDLPPQDTGGVPEWGIAAGELFQRGMTGLERRQFELMFVRDPLTGDRPPGDPRSQAVGSTLVDATGTRVFTDEQISELSGKHGGVLDRLYDAAMQLSGIQQGKTGAAAAKDELKNSPPTSGSDFSTA